MTENKFWTKTINGKKFITNQERSLPSGKGHKKVFMIKWGQYLFACFTSRKEQLAWWTNTHKKMQKSGKPFEAYEVMYGDSPCSFFADIEVYCPLKADYIDSLKARIVSDVTSRCEELDEHSLVWSEDHRETKGLYKISFHVVGGSRLFRGIVKNGPMARLAVEVNTVSEKIFEDYPDISSTPKEQREMSVLDMCVYTKNRSMRGPRASKGVGSRGFLPCAGSEGRDLEDFFICKDIPVDDYRDYDFVPNIIIESAHQRAVAVDRIQTRKVAPTPAQSDLECQIQSYLSATQNTDTIKVVFNGLYGAQELPSYRVDGSGRSCHVCDKVHGSNGAFVKELPTKALLYTCMSSMKSQILPIFGRVLKTARVLDTIDPADGRVPDIRTIKDKCINIIAGMNTGKTYRANQLVEALGETLTAKMRGEDHGKSMPPRKLRVLIITCRVSMASGLDFRFKGFDQYTDTIDSDKLIIEYESLHRTDRLYDIIIIDEVRSVLTSATTYATNRSSLARNMERLKKNMAHAKKVIFSDADSDLDGAVQYFIHNNFSSYTEIRLEKPVMRRKYRLMKKSKTEKTMIDDIREGRHIVASFGSRTHMEAVEKLIHQELGIEIKIRTYAGQSPHKKELKNIEKFWPAYQVIMYTSCVTVALDYNNAVFRVFAFPKTTTMSPREMLQSIGRSRNVLTNEVVVSVDNKFKLEGRLHPNFDMDFIYDDQLNLIKEKRKTLEMMEETVDEDGRIKWVPNHITKLWAYNLAETTLKYSHWYAHFLWILEKKQLECIDETHDGECKEDYDEVLKEFTKESEEEEIATFDEIDVSCTDHGWYLNASQNQRAGVSCRYELMQLRKYKVQRFFKDSLGGKDIIFYEKHHRQIWNQLAMTKLTREDMANFWRKDLKIDKDFAKNDYKVLPLLEDLLKQMGFSGFGDRSSKVDVRGLPENKGVIEILDQITAITMNTRNRAEEPLNRVKTYLESLTGIKMDNVQKQIRGERFRQYYITDKPNIKDMLELNHTMMTDSWIQNRRESWDPKMIPEREQTTMADRWIELRQEQQRAQEEGVHVLKKVEEECEKEKQQDRKKKTITYGILYILVQTRKAVYFRVLYLYYVIYRKYITEKRHHEHKRLIQSQIVAFSSNASQKRRPTAKISDFFPEHKRATV